MMSTWNDDRRREGGDANRARDEFGGGHARPGNPDSFDGDRAAFSGGRDQREAPDRSSRPERRYPKAKSPRGDRTDIYATVFALGLAVFLLLGYALRPFTRGEGVPGKVARVADRASVDNGRAVARDLISDGAANFLWTAHWLAVAALLVVVVCGAGLTRNFLRGDFFTSGSYRWVAAMTWALLFYMFVPGFVGMLGGNMVLRDLGRPWMSIPALDTNDFIVLYVLVMTLSLVSVAIRRASVLERDTEGLV